MQFEQNPYIHNVWKTIQLYERTIKNIALLIFTKKNFLQ